MPMPGPTFSWDAVLARLRQHTLGEYEVMAELGRGGMAAVFLAHEIALNRRVALKVMSPSLMIGEGMIERFHQEARTQANLSHSNIVGVFGVRQADDLHYFVMQYVPGRSLQQVVKAFRASGEHLPIPVIRALLYQIGSALAFAHRKGVVHRDIKPANILLSAEGEAVVTDFGIAKVAEVPSHTLTGTVVGTPQYMSPEQCYAAELSGASDQYSLGIVAYELTTGQPPYSGSSFSVMQSHTLDPLPPLLERRPDCPPDFAAAIERMLAKQKSDRFPNVLAALTALGAGPVPNNEDDPVRHALVDLADIDGVARRLGDVLRLPQSPIPSSRRRPSSTRRSDEVTPVQPEVSARKAPLQLRLSDPPTRVEVGEIVQLSVTALAGAEPVEVPADLSWRSSDQAIASVGRDGMIEARAPGSVDIVVTSDDAVATARLIVREATPHEIVAESLPSAIEVGERAAFRVLVRDKRGRALDRKVQWTARGREAASFDSAALTISGQSPGTVVLVAKVDPISAQFTIAVHPATPTRIDVEGPPDVIGVGESVVLRSRVFDRRGAPIADASLAWGSANPTIATVDGEGRVRALERGVASIWVRCGTVEARTPVEVGVVRLGRLEVEGMVDSLRVGAKRALRTRAVDPTGSVRSLHVEWLSSDPQVAVVNAESNVVALAAGDTVLRARCGTVERTFPLSVTEEVSPPPHVPDAAMPSTRLPEEASVHRSPGRLLGISIVAVVGAVALFVWNRAQSSTPATPSTVEAVPAPRAPEGGTGIPSGTPTTRDSNLVSVDSAATVAPPPPPPDSGLKSRAEETATIEIVGAPPSLTVGEKVRLRTRPAASGGRRAPRWRSLSTAFATVDASTGVVSAVAEGTAVIELRVGEQTQEVRFAVVPPQLEALFPAGVSRLRQNESASLSVVGRDAKGKVVEVKGATWSSSRPEVLSVDAIGNVRAVAPGNATILVTRGEVVGRHDVLVEALPRAPERQEPPKRDSVVTPPSSVPAPAPVQPTPGAPVAALNESVAACYRIFRNLAPGTAQELVGGTDTERQNARRLLTLVRDESVKATVLGEAGQPVVTGSRAARSLKVEVSWRDFTGRNSKRVLNVDAVATLSGSEWTERACRIQGDPKFD